MDTADQRITHAITSSGNNASSIAKKIGISPEAVLQWMSGATKNIKNAYLFQLADITGFNARWLATGEGPERDPGGDPRKQALTALYDKLDERGKDAVFRVAQTQQQYVTHPDEPAAATGQ